MMKVGIRLVQMIRATPAAYATYHNNQLKKQGIRPCLRGIHDHGEKKKHRQEPAAGGDYPLGEEPPEVAGLFLHVRMHPCFHGDGEIPHIF